MAIKTNDGTAQVKIERERVSLSNYKAMTAVNTEARTLSAARIWTLMRSILREIELHGAPYASTIEDSRRAMEASDVIDAQSYHLAMGCEIVPDNQLALPLEHGA